MVSAFCCYALKILLHCNILFTYLSYWPNAPVFDLEIIKFIFFFFCHEKWGKDLVSFPQMIS